MSKVDYAQKFESSVDAITMPLNVGSVANRYVLAFVFGTNTTINSVTIGGVAMTQLVVDTNINGPQFAMYGAVVAATGVLNIVPTWSGISGSKLVQAVSYNDVSGIRGAAVSGKAGENLPSLTLATVANDIVVMMGNDNLFGYTFTPAAPATLLTVGTFDASLGAYFGCEETASGTSTTVNGTLTANCPWGATAAALIPAGTAPFAGNAQAVATAAGALRNGSTITTKQLKNNTGFVYANLAGCVLLIYHPTTHALVQALTGLTTNASGVISEFVSNLAPGTYFYDVITPNSERRLRSLVSL